MALLGHAARSPHALAGRSRLGAGKSPEAAIRPAVCAADLVCVPTGGANASSGLCASLDTYTSITDPPTMTLSHPDRADLQLNAWFFSLGGVTAGLVTDSVFSSTPARHGFSLGENPLPCGAGVGRAEETVPITSSHACTVPRCLSK